MVKYRKHSAPSQEDCQAEADEVKYMMLLNALNESHNGREIDDQSPHKKEEESDSLEQK